jgi:hypothetical protein
MHPKVAAFASLFPPFIRHAKTDPLRNAKTLRNSQVFLPSPKFTHSIPRRSFIFFRAFVGLLHDIAPSAQVFSDAGKPRFFGGRKTAHVVADFVEHIDDAVDPLERLRDFYRRRHFFKLPS